MAIASETMENLAIYAYWILGIMIIGTMCYIMYTRFNKQVAAVLVFLTSMLALYYYYVKWFIVGDSYKESVTVCPDFMTPLQVFSDAGDNKQFVCYDSTKFASKTDATTAFATLNKTTSNGEVISDKKFIITPTVNEIPNFCSTLKNQGLSWIALCKTVSS